MEFFQTFIMLMFAAAILIGIAQKIHIPYPLALVLGGTAISFIPYEHSIYFEPNLILYIVLPPLLYYAAFGISFREFKRNINEILYLALGLVVFTTLIIGVIFKGIFPQFSWALAFTFGAIVSPPDAIAATTILKRFSINTRLLTILEGESLINDASALVLYRMAVVALLSGAFSLTDGVIEFTWTVSGGIVIGLALGYILQNFSRRYLEPVVAVVFSFTIPYITYFLADYLGVSGVLAVVVNGLLGSQLLIRHYSPLRRILGYASWDIFIILMNCFVFILIGLQLQTLTSKMSMAQMLSYSGYAIVFTLAMILVRMIWVYGKIGVSYFNLKKHHSHFFRSQNLSEAALIGWSGMRGIVSLTAALAIPLTHSNGTPLEGRSEVIFIIFIIILLTLLIPGFTLPSLIRYLNIHQQTEHHKLPKIRTDLAKVAEETLHQMHTDKKINDQEFHLLYIHLHFQSSELGLSEYEKSQSLESAINLIIQEKRKKLFELWENSEISDRVMIQLEHELDLEETHLARAELK